MRKSLLSISLVAALFALGVADPTPEILVFGAASLTESLTDLGKAYEAKTGTKVVFSFGASSDLARQIQAGAPADVFFSADTAKMDALEKAGLVKAADRREFLSNSLVVVVPADSNSKSRRPKTSRTCRRSRSRTRGRSGRRLREEVAHWPRPLGEDRTEGRSDPRRPGVALAAVESGAIPAGVVYSTDAAVAKAARVAFKVTNGPEIVYSVAPVAASKNLPSADAFVAFLAGPDGRAEFTKRGFVIRDVK